MSNTCFKCGKSEVMTEFCSDCLLGTSKIENNFKYHSPKEGQPKKYEDIREKAKELAYLIDELCPNSREKSVAMTELETAVMWANASIARN